MVVQTEPGTPGAMPGSNAQRSHWSIEVNTCDKSLGAQHHQPTSLGRSCCPNYAQVESVGSQTARLNRSTLSICLSPEHVPLYFQLSFSLRLVPHSRQYRRKMSSLQAYLPPARLEVQRSRKFPGGLGAAMCRGWKDVRKRACPTAHLPGRISPSRTTVWQSRREGLLRPEKYPPHSLTEDRATSAPRIKRPVARSPSSDTLSLFPHQIPQQCLSIACSILCPGLGITELAALTDAIDGNSLYQSCASLR